MSSEAISQATREEWRSLGFFYDRNDVTREWGLVGSRAGLLRFRDLLLAYVADPSHERQSEHEHYGPYMYLEVMTWPEAGCDGHAIHGTLADFSRLASLLKTKLQNSKPNSRICIREEFSEDSPYALVLDVREDGFDPAEADPLLPK